jgi:hypothetical protein
MLQSFSFVSEIFLSFDNVSDEIIQEIFPVSTQKFLIRFDKILGCLMENRNFSILMKAK